MASNLQQEESALRYVVCLLAIAALFIAPAAWAQMGAEQPFDQLTDRITCEHRQLQGAATQVQQAQDPQQRQRQFQKVKELALPHMAAEEATLYQALRDNPQTTQAAAQAFQEHCRQKQLISQLDQMSPDSPEWQGKFQEFVSATNTHIQNEEQRVLPQARTALRPGQAEQIFSSFISQEQQTYQAMR